MGNVTKLYTVDDIKKNGDLAEYLTIRVNRKDFLDKMEEIGPVSGPVEEGDYLLASLYGQTPRYQKENVCICVGSGAQGKTFEAALAGTPLGENLVTLDGQDIRVVIHSIKRKQKAVPSDAYAARQLIDGIDTLDQLLNKRVHDYANMQKEFLSGRIFVEVLNIMCDRSEFTDMEGDVAEETESMMSSYQYKADEKGLPLEAVFGDTPEIQQASIARVKERAALFAHYHAVVRYLAAQEGVTLQESAWGREANGFTSARFNPCFEKEFRILYEDGTEEQI